MDSYRFGPFRLDADKKVLLKEDQPIPLTPKVFETLLVLVENRGRVLDKDEMMGLLWPDSFVEEANLSQNISVLRRALGEGAKDSKYIITVPGRGYRFREETLFENGIIVQEQSTTEFIFEQETFNESEPVVSKPQTSLFLRLSQSLFNQPVVRRFLIIIPVAAVIAGTFWFLGSHWSTPQRQVLQGGLPSLELVNWKSESAEDYSEASFSPYNWEIAYTEVRDGKPAIYCKQININARENKITDGNWNDHSPIWSPNGQEIAFISDRAGKPGIWRIPASGGTALHVWDLPYSKASLRHWSKDGTTLYLESDLNLFALNINTEQITQITRLPGGQLAARYFSISANETEMAYLDGGDQQSEIWVRPLAGGEAKRVLAQPERIRNLVWNPDGRRIVYNVQRDGYYQIAEFDIADGKPNQLTFERTDHFLLDVSANGGKILYNATKEESNLWSFNLDSGSEIEITSDMAFKFWPDVSPDGDQVVFQSIRNMSMAISMTRCSLQIRSISNPGNQRTLVEDAISPRWSPDGKYVAFLRSRDGKWNIWVIDTAGGRPRMLTTRGVYTAGWSQLPYNRRQTSYFRWSRDGTKLIYATSDDDAAGIWEVAADGSGEAKIVERETPNRKPYLRLHCPIWSNSEKYVAGISYEESAPSQDTRWTLWITNLETHVSHPVYSSQLALRVLGWSESDDRVIIASKVGNKGRLIAAADYQIVQISPENGEAQTGQLLESAYLYNMQLSPDGRTLAFDCRVDGHDEFYLLALFSNKIEKLTINSDQYMYFSSLTWSPDGKRFFFSKQQRWSIISVLDQYQ